MFIFVLSEKLESFSASMKQIDEQQTEEMNFGQFLPNDFLRLNSTKVYILRTAQNEILTPL